MAANRKELDMEIGGWRQFSHWLPLELVYSIRFLVVCHNQEARSKKQEGRSKKRESRKEINLLFSVIVIMFRVSLYCVFVCLLDRFSLRVTQ